MNGTKSFSISAALAENTHPYSKKFESGAMAGLEIKYRDLPEHWADIAEEAIGAELASLGFNPPVAIQSLLNQIELTGEEYLEHRNAYDALTARQKASLADITKQGFAAVLAETIGDWNNSDAGPTAEYLRLLPQSFLRAVFALASNVTMSLEQRDFLGK